MKRYIRGLLREELLREGKHNLRINDILNKYKNYIKSKGVGYLGQLDVSDLINPEIFRDEYGEIDNKLYSIYTEEEDEIDYSKVFGEYDLYKIWYNYKRAMERNRIGGYLDFESFMNYLLNYGGVYMYEYNDSYIIGHYKNGIFKPSHFSTENIREGNKMIKSIIRYDNIIFAVTEDLKKMLVKLGAFTDKNLVIPMIFRDMLVEKHIIFTSPDIMAKVLYKLKNEKNVGIEDFEEMTYSDMKQGLI
jgi:hypothetical protein